MRYKTVIADHHTHMEQQTGNDQSIFPSLREAAAITEKMDGSNPDIAMLKELLVKAISEEREFSDNFRALHKQIEVIRNQKSSSVMQLLQRISELEIKVEDMQRLMP
jgi:hypothetical protein